jgi:hypothetical protein
MVYQDSYDSILFTANMGNIYEPPITEHHKSAEAQDVYHHTRVSSLGIQKLFSFPRNSCYEPTASSPLLQILF